MDQHWNVVDREPQLLPRNGDLQQVAPIMPQITKFSGGNQWPPAEPANVLADRIGATCCAQLRKYIVLFGRAIAQNNPASLVVIPERSMELDVSPAHAVLHVSATYRQAQRKCLAISGRAVPLTPKLLFRFGGLPLAKYGSPICLSAAVCSVRGSLGEHKFGLSCIVPLIGSPERDNRRA